MQVPAALPTVVGVGANGRTEPEHEGTEQPLCVHMSSCNMARSMRGRSEEDEREGEREDSR